MSKASKNLEGQKSDSSNEAKGESQAEKLAAKIAEEVQKQIEAAIAARVKAAKEAKEAKDAKDAQEAGDARKVKEASEASDKKGTPLPETNSGKEAETKRQIPTDLTDRAGEKTNNGLISRQTEATVPQNIRKESTAAESDGQNKTTDNSDGKKLSSNNGSTESGPSRSGESNSTLTSAVAYELHEKTHRWAIDPRTVNGTDIDQSLNGISRTSGDMQKLRQEYQAAHGSDLLQDLKAKLPDSDYRRISGIISNPESDYGKLDNALTKVDGNFSAVNRSKENTNGLNAIPIVGPVLNAAGTVVNYYSSHEAAKQYKGAQKELTQQIQTMTSGQLENANKESIAQTGKDLHKRIAESTDPDYQAAAKLLLKGSDRRTDEDNVEIAKHGISGRHSHLIEAGLSGDSNAGARRLFNSDSANLKELKRAFPGQSNEDKTVEDIARSGSTTIASHIKFNQSVFGNNQEMVQSAAANMTDSERAALRRGRELNQGSVTPANVTAGEIQSMENQRQFEQNLKNTYSPVARAGIEAQVYHGSDNLISKLAAKHSDGIFGTGLGGGSNGSDVIRTLDEQVSASDSKRLTSDPTFKKDLGDLLSKMLSKDDLQKAEGILSRKAESGDYTKSVRDTKDKLGDLDWQTGQGKAIDLLTNMNETEQSKLRTDKQYATDLSEQINRVFGNGTDGASIANSLVSSAQSGKKLELSPIDTLTVGGLKKTSLSETITNIENLTQDKALRERVKNPSSEEDLKVSNLVKNQLHQAIMRSGHVSYDEDGKSNSDKIFDRLYKCVTSDTGKVDLGTRLEFTDRDSDAREIVSKLSPEERAKILDSKNNESDVVDSRRAINARFSDPELTKELLNNGQTPQAIIRGYSASNQALTDQEKAQVKETVSGIKDPQAFSNSYASMFKKQPSEILDKIPANERAEVGSKLQVGDTSHSELIERANNRQQTLKSGLLGSFDSGAEVRSQDELRKLADNGDFSADALKKQATRVEKAQDIYGEDKRNTANTVADVGVTAVSIVGTGGGASLARMAAQGALTQFTIKQSLMGADYSKKEAAIDLIRGGVNGGLNKIGTEGLTGSTGVLPSFRKEFAQNVRAATLAGAGSGAVDGFTKWDTTKSAQENLTRVAGSTGNAAITSAGTAAVLFPLLKAGQGLTRNIAASDDGSVLNRTEQAKAPDLESASARVGQVDSQASPLITREGVSNRSAWELKPEYGNMTQEQANNAMKDFTWQDYTSKALQSRNQDVVTYKARNGVTIDMPLSQEPMAIETRLARLEASKNPENKELQSIAQSKSHVYLPEDIASDLEKLPLGGVKHVNLDLEKGSYADLWHGLVRNKQSLTESGVADNTAFKSAASATAGGEISFYPGTTRETGLFNARHEWSHVFEDMQKTNRSVFNDALKLENQRDMVNGRPYALHDIEKGSENWAVNLGEEILHKGGRGYYDLIDKVAGSSSAVKHLVLTNALEKELNSSLSAGGGSSSGLRKLIFSQANPSQAQSDLMMRLGEAERKLYPAAEKQLQTALETGSQSEQAASLRILATVGRDSSVPSVQQHLSGQSLEELSIRLQSDSVLADSPVIHQALLPRIQAALKNVDAAPGEASAALHIASKMPRDAAGQALNAYVGNASPASINSMHLKNTIEDVYKDGKVPVELFSKVFAKESSSESWSAAASSSILRTWFSTGAAPEKAIAVNLLENGSLSELWKKGKLEYGAGLINGAVVQGGVRREELFDLAYKQLASNPGLQRELLFNAKYWPDFKPDFLARYQPE